MQTLREACVRGDLDGVTALLDFALMAIVPVELVVAALDRGHAQVALCLVSMISSIKPQFQRKYRIRAAGHQVAAWACNHGRMDVLGWLVQAFSSPTRPHMTRLVQAACARSDVAMAMRLMEWGWARVPRDRAAQWVFSVGCTHGHVGLLQQLVTQGLVADVRFGHNRAFRTACGRGHLGVAKWLVTQGEVDVHCRQDAAFRGACRYGHWRVAQWLASRGGVDIHARHSSAFKSACAGSHGARTVAVCRCLATLDPAWAHWPPGILQAIRAWSSNRDAWMRSVVSGAP